MKISTNPSNSMNDATINNVDQNATQDKDLVELAGFHAYQKPFEPAIIHINNKPFEVIDTNYGHETGLDALTVQNVETAELTIVYVGSEQLQEDWIDTNLRLPNRLPPAQIEA
jgi:hypothetical protein